MKIKNTPISIPIALRAVCHKKKGGYHATEKRKEEHRF